MHRLHNSFSQGWYLLIWELAPVEIENSVECSQHVCTHMGLHVASTGLIQTQLAAALLLEVLTGPVSHPKHQAQFFTSFPSSHKQAFSPNHCLPPAPTALPSPEPEMQILAEQARQAEDSAEAASAINKSFLKRWQFVHSCHWTAAAQQSLPVQSPTVWPRGSPLQWDNQDSPSITPTALKSPNALAQEHTLSVLPLKGLAYDTAEVALLSNS